jgi:two-component system, OmpR family, phosphate regulon sensor histidine kinase PhoR
MNPSHSFRIFLAVFSFLILFALAQQALSPFLSSPSTAAAVSLLLLITPAWYIAGRLGRPVRRLNRRVDQLTRTLSRKGGGPATAGTSSPEEGDVLALERAVRDEVEREGQEKSFLSKVLNAMAEGVFVVDGRGRIVLTNEALGTLFSLPSEMLERTPLEVIRHAGLDKAIQKVLNGAGRQGLELIPVGGSGKTLDVIVIPFPGTAEGPGQRPGRERALVVFHDITRLKELERARRDFVANVSHELKTPLTTIKGYAETLLDGAVKEPVATQFIHVIQRHADRLSKIVEDLLTLSRIESEASPFKKTPLFLSDLVEDAIEAIRDRAEPRQIIVEAASIPPSVSLLGDRPYLELVLINLLDNAVKYSSERGRVTIKAAEEDGGFIRITVEDTGVGIPVQDLPRVFERFYRVDKGRSREVGGTGLGLSIVKHIVQGHGGKVWAESIQGRGSSFHLTLPMVSSAETVSPETPIPSPSAGS